MARWGTFAVGLTAAVAGLLVGSLLLGDSKYDVVGAGTVVTTVGTFVLGLATFYLAFYTRGVVEAAQDERESARKQLRVAQRQLKVANATLESQTQPFLTVGSREPRLLSGISVHVRNAGNATAVVKGGMFLFGPEGSNRPPAVAIEPAIPPGETSAVTVAEGWAPANLVDDYSVALGYADVTGRMRGHVRLDVRRVKDRWHVYQVHWDETLDGVVEHPALSSQPMNPG